VTVRVDIAAVTGLATEFTSTAAELTRIAAAVQAVVVHPALGWAAPRAPVRLARAVADLERALLGSGGLAAMPAAYAALAADAGGQVAELAAAEAGGSALSGVWGAVDEGAGVLAGAALRTADLPIELWRGVLDGWIPEGPGVAREVPTPAPGELSTVAGLFRRIDGLAVGEVEVVPVRGLDGAIRYLMLLRGIEPSLNPTVNTPGQAVKSSHHRSDSYRRAVAEALRRAGVPSGSELMVVGHSQGGITAMNLAAAGGYRVTHVIAAGAPIANKRSAGARVLSIENRGDLVPALDGVRERAGPQRTVYRFGTDRWLSRAAEHHGLASGYLPEFAGPRFGADPGVDAYLRSAAPYLLGTPAGARRFRLESGPYLPAAPVLSRRRWG
jgi:hypothetical protein